MFGASRAASAPSALIEAHKAAFRQFNEICGFEDECEDSDPRYSELCAEWERLSDVEEEALMALCRSRSTTMQEVISAAIISRTC